MAATKFADLHPLIRALLGDSDPYRPLYSRHVLDSHLRLQVLSQSPDNFQEAGTSAVFAKELTNNQKALLVYLVGKAIVSQNSGSFSYRNPVTSVSRSAVGAQLLIYIEQRLTDLDGGMALEYDTDLTAILNGAYSFWSAYQQSIQELQSSIATLNTQP